MTVDIAQCEAALIGSIILDPRVLSRVEPLVTAADFADDHLGQLYATLAMLGEAGKPVHDGLWLFTELQRQKLPEDVCCHAALHRFTDTAVHAGHAVYYAEHIAAAGKLRRLGVLAGDLRSKAADVAADPADVRSWLDGELAKLDSRQPCDAPTLGELAMQVADEADAAATADRKRGVFTGLDGVDSVAGPMMPGEMVVIAARPGCGKTALGAQIAAWSAARGRKSLVVSLEMAGAEIARRVVCAAAGLDSRDVRAGNLSAGDRVKIREAAESISLPCRIWSPASATMQAIRATARYHAAVGGLSLLVIDYIGLIRSAGDDRRLQRWEQVGRISAALKTLSKEIAVPVVALCQLNREAGDGSEPRLSQLRESGTIEQDADVVYLLHRTAADSTDLIIAKHRHGETGKVSLRWLPHETRFESLSSF